MAPPATLTDLFPEQPANHGSSHGRRARAVRSLFFGKERAPSESVLGVRAVPLFAENPRRGVLGNPYPYARIAYSRRRQMQVNKCLPTDLPGPNQPPIAGCGEAPYACSASFREEFFSETQGM